MGNIDCSIKGIITEAKLIILASATVNGTQFAVTYDSEITSLVLAVISYTPGLLPRYWREQSG